MRKRLIAIQLVVFLVFASSALADDADFAGAWMLEIKVPAETLSALLEIERQGDALLAFVEGGPAPLTINGNRIEVVIDSRDRQGYEFKRKLNGVLRDGVMSGTMSSIDVLESAAEFGEDGSAWSATRYQASEPEHPIRDPGELAGIWVPLRGVDIRKYTMSLTPAAKEWHTGYDARMDEPQKRCVSPGLVAAITWSFPFEIAASGDKLIMLYEAFNLSRRVFLDARHEPEFYPESSMGFSRGKIVNGELLIETSLLSSNVRDFNGEPISANARTVERYRLSDNGNRLSLVLTLHDPHNYLRPPIRRRAWTRKNDAVIYPFECDPDSFFRQLYNEGRMQEYIDRSPRRP
jgi:hypothetical protein